MKYYTTCSKIFSIGFESFLPYAIKLSENSDAIYCEMDDRDIEHFKDNFDFTPTIWGEKKINLFGSDGFYYILSSDGLEKTNTKCNLKNLDKYYKSHLKFSKSTTKNETWIESQLIKSDKTQYQEQGARLLHFKSYVFIDKENAFAFKYRFKRSKEKAPLVIYFHGAGALGKDNIKPLFDGIIPTSKIYRNCNVLIPQQPTRENERYWASIHHLIKKLVKNNSQIDEKRIYLIGTSLGATNVWNLIYHYPQIFACGVAAMGSLDIWGKGNMDVSRMKDIPLWVVHAENDKNVTVKVDDFYVAKLKELGAPVQYTRPKKHGHNIANIFYIKEPWDKWMLFQTK